MNFMFERHCAVANVDKANELNKNVVTYFGKKVFGCLRATTFSLELGAPVSEVLIMDRTGHRDVKLSTLR